MRALACLWLTAWVVALSVDNAGSEILRVPGEYPTIGAALNAVQNDDTVLVSLGTYAEELTAPPRRFWLIGDVEPDTGDSPRPVIDPSTLDSARWRRCLTIPDSCEMTIERMKFVNRAPMYPRTGWNSGGIFVHSVEPATFRFCAFDSVYRAIVDAIDTLPPPPLPVRYVIEHCCFTNAPRIQVRGSESDLMVIRRSYFQANRCTSMLVLGGHQAFVEDCVFEGISTAGALYMSSYSDGLYAVRRCTFGPIDSCTVSVLRLSTAARADVEDNIFQHIGCLDLNFADLTWVAGHPITIRHNQFIGNQSLAADASLSLKLRYVGDLPTEFTALIDSNSFADYNSSGEDFYGKALAIGTPAAIQGNRFVNLRPRDEPTIVAYLNNSSLVRFRHNQFEAQDYAVRAETRAVDATYNFWGDASGPYNATYNPDGQGARVDDSVLFDPWCPDTNCFESAPDPARILHPSSFILSCYPNPFNSTLHLTLIPAEVGIVKVELFDVLGRRASEIWHGPLAFQRDISFDASALASGIYFARVTDVISRKHLALTKLVLMK